MFLQTSEEVVVDMGEEHERVSPLNELQAQAFYLANNLAILYSVC